MLILSPGILRSAVGPLHRWKRGLASLSQHQPSPSQTAPSPGPSMHEAKKEGTIETFFQSLTDAEQPPLPPRFSALKKEIVKDPQALERSWKAVLKELEGATDEIAKKENEMVLSVPFEDIERGLSEDQLKHLKKTGVIIIRGGVPREVASGWLQSLKDYVAANSDKVIAAPAGKPIWYEIYNAPAQVAARTHPSLVNTQKYLLSLWHASPAPDGELPAVSPRTAISYFDRFRIRQPGPSGSFTLGPHIDGGSIERWEDPAFRRVFGRILEGGDGWRRHDPFDITPRLSANQDLYHAPSQCSIFRPWQGWTALSSTGPGQGTLRVLPSLSLATAYIILRPFFRLRPELAARRGDTPLDADAWELDLDSTAFPGSTPGNGQAVLEATHPHLRLDKTVVSIPRVEPGDQVYWHTDVVHAVEGEHNGAGESSVIYIPAVPLTEKNAIYLRAQRETFVKGAPPPDFPGGVGESLFAGRGMQNHITSPATRQLLGFEPFVYSPYHNEGERRAIERANQILGF